MKHRIAPTLLSIFAASFCAVSVSQAQNPFFNEGDLVLFFQKPGNNNTIYVSLGSAALLYRGDAAGPTADRQTLNIINIDDTLSTAFDEFNSTWKTDDRIFAGLAACRSSSSSTTLLIDGDPARTLYASQRRQPLGSPGSASSEAWDFTTSGFAGPATNIFAMNNKLETEYTTQAAVSPVSVSTIDDQNPIESVAGSYLQPSAFNSFPGGVQQQATEGDLGSFGPVNQVKFALDLYRILPRTSVTNQIMGPDKMGSYEGTIVVDIDGNVSFITQGAAPTSAFTTWIDSFNPPLADPADREPTADPDNDGIENLLEFVLDGNPGVADRTILPTLDTSGENFVFTFNRRDDAKTETTQVFQYGSDMVGWTDVVIGEASAGMVTVAPNGTDPDTITVTVPKGANTRMFGRLMVTK